MFEDGTFRQPPPADAPLSVNQCWASTHAYILEAARSSGFPLLALDVGFGGMPRSSACPWWSWIYEAVHVLNSSSASR